MKLSKLFLFMDCITGIFGVRVIEQPQDQCVSEGSTANFKCVFDSSIIPHWSINGTLYSSRTLQFAAGGRYSYLNRQLTISNVQQSDNNTSFQCLLLSLSVLSRTAQLIVTTTLREMNEACIATATTDVPSVTASEEALAMTSTTAITTATEAASETATITTTILTATVVVASATATNATGTTMFTPGTASHPTAESRTALLTSATDLSTNQNNVVIIIGTVCSLGIVIFLCTCTALLSFLKIRSHYSSQKAIGTTTTSQSDKVVYEDVTDVYYSRINRPHKIQFSLTETKSAPSNFHMNNNESYVTVTKIQDFSSSPLTDTMKVLRAREDISFVKTSKDAASLGNESQDKLQGLDNSPRVSSPAVLMICNTCYDVKASKEDPVYAEVEV